MSFSVVHIKKPLPRRVALILLSPPVVILTWMNQVANVTWGVIRDYPKAFKSAWRGY